MFKMLIADDEQIVLDSIKFIIEKNFEEVIVADTARSGRDAIEKAEMIIPDIVFMDIKMPGINGIDAIREIKLHNKNAQFVILTAYDQFDFAKEAVNLGVSEYLLKPVNRDKIIQVVHGIIEKIKSEREKRKRELELKEKFESVLPVLEYGFIYSILLFDDNARELENYMQILEIPEKSGYIMTMEFGESEKSGTMGNRIGLSVKSQSFYPYIRDAIKYCCRCLVGPVMLNRIVVFVPCEVSDDEYNYRLEALNIARNIYAKISEKVDADFCVGIGRIYTGIENLSRSYDESLKAIRYAESKGIIHIMDVPSEGVYNSEYPVMKEKLLLEKASQGDTSVCLEAFSFIFDWLVAEYNEKPLKIKGKLFELIVLLQRTASDYGVDESEIAGKKDYFIEMLNIEDMGEIKAWCRQNIERVVNGINSIRDKKISTVILKAREYIDHEFQNDITLEDVSKEVNISPHYFSKLFKEETGENFIDYLTSVRIQKAKEYLNDGRYNMKEICYQIGYGDPNYFSRIFKKIVGITPTEYKDTVSKKM
ncbi:MAG: response regulator [Clostridia bacterium]|nr:response regulator [Clostridia bacterium]